MPTKDELLPCPYKVIELTKGKSAKVDLEDYNELINFKWHAIQTRNRCYAARNNEKNGRKFYVHMHRQIMGTIDQSYNEVDHINGDTLDNRKSNLRVCSHSENLKNQKAQVGRSSKYKGVYKSKKDGYWVVQIKDQGRMRTVHGVDNEEIAAMIYDLLAIDRFGEFARPNIIKDKEAIKAWNTRPRCDECKYLDATGLCFELYAKYFEYDPDLYSEDYRQICFHVRPEKDFHCAKFSRRED